jgi:hypothetical protein
MAIDPKEEDKETAAKEADQNKLSGSGAENDSIARRSKGHSQPDADEPRAARCFD